MIIYDAYLSWSFVCQVSLLSLRTLLLFYKSSFFHPEIKEWMLLLSSFELLVASFWHLVMVPSLKIINVSHNFLNFCPLLCFQFSTNIHELWFNWPTEILCWPLILWIHFCCPQHKPQEKNMINCPLQSLKSQNMLWVSIATKKMMKSFLMTKLLFCNYYTLVFVFLFEWKLYISSQATCF